mgnify:CR=1 FL=1
MIADECWASYLIAKRHKYQIHNLSMWCDYLRMLKKLGQDSVTRRTFVPKIHGGTRQDNPKD